MLSVEELNQIIKDALKLQKQALLDDEDFVETVKEICDRRITEREQEFMRREPKQ